MSSLSSQFSHMSETMSSPSDWAHFYPSPAAGGHDNPSTTMFGGRAASESTVVTSTQGSGSISPTGSHLSPEGRVAKPIRRRSRASRRTPTTLLNTDTTNFRAMVQQFTGYPSPHFAPGSHHGGGATNFNFGLGSASQQTVNPRAVMGSSAAGYQLQFQQQLQQQQQYHHHHHHHQQPQDYMLSLSNSRPNMDVSDHGFIMQTISAHVPPRTSSSNENTQSNNYMF
ncbi:VQ motif-containing protein 22 [Cornus florida]|uniref:VQ motif-containing protein 22 n=1 Tax=Cornus florida TaxID=4283 RepID=UPI002898DD20|nr:VQ motif-containing protein 22 [Cornus florida]